MKAGRIIALICGCLLFFPGLGMLMGGTAVSLVYAFGRDDDGYFDATLDQFESDTAAITVGEDLVDDPGPPDWLFDLIDAEIRIRATAADPEADLFVGIAREATIVDYLEGVERDKITGLDGLEPEYQRLNGGAQADPPGEETFWVESAEGTGTQEIEWEIEGGNWGAVLMNADGSPGISTEVNFGAKSGILLVLGLIVLSIGWIMTAGAVLLVVYGIRGARVGGPGPPQDAGGVAAPASGPAAPAEAPSSTQPVTLTAQLDPGLSRWQWLVKWFLAIPHFIVLFFLWLAFALLTFIAAFAILFTGRYPRSMFDFNVGVLRWSWRVTYYAAAGGLGTDQYPPFSLDAHPDYPATLEVSYPEQLSRGLVLVKWWLLAIPHYVIVSILLGGSSYWAVNSDGDWIWVTAGGGLLGVLVFFAAVALLFSGRYPRGLFDVIIGFNRWIARVTVYAVLMTDEYPPFRLDQGGADPGSEVAEGSDVESGRIET